MGFFDNFWIPQSQIPPTSVLVVFVIFHLLFLSVISLLYFVIRNQILKSAAGPLPQYQLQVPNKLLRGVKFIYIGSFLIIFDNLLTHFFAIVSSKKAYFSIGASSLFAPLGAAITILGSSIFFTELFAIPQNRKKSMSSFFSIIRGQIILFYLFIIAEVFLIKNYSWFGEGIIFAGILMIILTLLEIYYIQRNEMFMNKLLKLRFYSSYVFAIALILTTMVGIFYLPNNSPPNQWHTRNSEIEIFLFVLDFWSVFNVLLVFMIINVPKWVRDLFNIKEEEFNLYRDERIDYNWDSVKKSYLFNQPTIKPTTYNSADQYIFFYNENFEKLSVYIQQFAPKFNSEIILKMSSFEESYFHENILPQKNLLIFTHETKYYLHDIVNYIETEFQFYIEIDENLIVNEFEYVIEGYECAAILVVPSPWNFTKKIWIVYAPIKLIATISLVLNKFYGYFNDISDEEAIFCILKFPVEKNIATNIPSSSTDETIPEPRNLIFL